jgi:hypothetical protein
MSVSDLHLDPISTPSLSAPRHHRGKAPNAAGPMMPLGEPRIANFFYLREANRSEEHAGSRTVIFCSLASSSYTWPTQRPLPQQRSSGLPYEHRASRTVTSLRVADLGIQLPPCRCHTMAPIPNLPPPRQTGSTTFISRSRDFLTSNNRSNGSGCSSIARYQAQAPRNPHMASTLADQAGTTARRRP